MNTLRDVSPSRAADYLQRLPEGRYTVEVKKYRETRSNEQNKKLWAMLGEISRTVDWHGQKLMPEEWKDVFTAALKRQKVVPGIDGGFVVLGTSTRRMTIDEMSTMIELMFAFGAEHGVKFLEDYMYGGIDENPTRQTG